MLNALTIDVEDYFQVTAFERRVRRDQWDHYPLRVDRNTLKILDMLEECGIKATFFILGWIAERLPRLIKDIQTRGHEIGCHGYGHELIYRIGPEKFRQDIRKAKAIIEEICGQPVHGYRAPSYSITDRSLWALDILVEEGFDYDSSIFPVYHDNYGIPNAPRYPHEITTASGVIREFPLSTLRFSLLGKEYRLPVAGGGYLRLFPSTFLNSAIRKINKSDRKPAVLYFHPWEIDPDQPKIRAGLKSSFRHYLNLDSTEKKLRHILACSDFSTMCSVLDNGGIP